MRRRSDPASGVHPMRVVGRRVLRGHDVARAHAERQAGRDRAVERRDPVVALLEGPGDPDLRALVALAADHERDPAGSVEDPHPLVERASERDEPVHGDEVVVGQADGLVARLESVALRHRQLGHRHSVDQKLIERPSTAIAASPSDLGEGRVGMGRLPISQGVASSVNARQASAIRSVAWGPTMWTPSVSSRLAVRDDLGEALVLAADDGLGDRLERDLADLVRRPGGLDLLLGQADRRDLGPAVGRARLRVVVHLVDVGLARDRVGRGDPLVRRGVGEPQATDDVADRVDVRLLRPHVAVDLDDAAVGLDLRGLEPDVLDVGGAAGRDEHQLGAELGRLLALGADHHADPVLVGRDGLGVEPGVGHDRDAALREAALDDLADLARPRAARSAAGTRAA